MEVKIGDWIRTEWPGQDLQTLRITDIRPDERGILCVVFGKDGIVGAEAIDDLEEIGDEEGFVAWTVDTEAEREDILRSQILNWLGRGEREDIMRRVMKE